MYTVEIPYTAVVPTVAVIGLVAGLVLLVRGLIGYRATVRVEDTATSSIASLAAGEVRVSGVVEPAELTLVSLLQSVACVYYRSTVGDAGEHKQPRAGYTEERSIGFRVRDATGSLRVFPGGGRIDAPVRFEGETGTMGEEPLGLDFRLGGPTQGTETDRAVAAAELLRVRTRWDWSPLSNVADTDGRRTYREKRLEPGDPVTIVGLALPFSDLPDPAAADVGSGRDAFEVDPEVEADLAEAREVGLLADDPAEAWGNAAIPGFGIGRPVTEPDIDPAAIHQPLATPEEAARVARTFEIAPGTLVLAASEEVPLLIAFGVPGSVVERGQTRYLVGLLGAALAIGSAMVFALTIGDWLHP
jgi:hypothetical protein